MVDDKPELSQRLLWLMAIRVLVVASILLPYLVIDPTDPGSNAVSILKAAIDILFPSSADLLVEGPPRPPSVDSKMIQLLVAGVSIETLIFASLLRFLRHRPELQGYLQLLGDQILVTLLLYKFGAKIASISILYFVLIAVGGLLLRQSASVKLALAATVLYSSVAISHQWPYFRGLWEAGGPFSATSPRERISGEPPKIGFVRQSVQWFRPPGVDEVTGVPLAYNLAVHLLGFFSVAFFTRRLTRDPVLERRLEQRSRDLARLQVLHRDVIQSISSGLLTTDLEDRITSLNRAGEEILGIRELEVVGHPITESGLFEGPLWPTLQKQAEKTGQIRSETTLSDGAGRRLVIGFTISPLRDGAGAKRGYLLIFQDLSEWRALEDKLRQQDRMAALGQMAAGLAHEVGNPLAAISGSVQLLSSRFDGKASEQKLLDITLRESRRLDRTVKSFLQFARPQDHNPQEFDIAALIAEDVALLRHSDEVAPHHSIELELEPRSVNMVADRDQVGQIFWNLVRNALQAMPQGGRLKISGHLEGEKYRLEILDSGRGMTSEERQRLFQPFKSFFGAGLGLGMAIVYRLVAEHGGEILVDSEPGDGTRISVILPTVPPRFTPPPTLRPGSEPQEAGKELAAS